MGHPGVQGHGGGRHFDPVGFLATHLSEVHSGALGDCPGKRVDGMTSLSTSSNALRAASASSYMPRHTIAVAATSQFTSPSRLLNSVCDRRPREGDARNVEQSAGLTVRRRSALHSPSRVKN